ncbi:unnamed protein product [Symbiodinium natans]|uniref:Uncharacterized protein n=1 Tax=Symbiodinium natans TaxID=878477 RepID=A0A812SPG3_9DINO|nr:unnamed protein product [Symbiodinium natans]
MSNRAKLAGALGVADLLEADLRKPLPLLSPKRDNAQSQACAAGYTTPSSPMMSTALDTSSATELQSKSIASQCAQKVGKVVDVVQATGPAATPSGGYGPKAAQPDHAFDEVHAATETMPSQSPPRCSEKTAPEKTHQELKGIKEPTRAAGYPRKPSGAGLPKAPAPGVAIVSPPAAPEAATPSAHCTISEGGASEIRTKVFRIGAPLLRSTIPVTVGGRRESKGVNMAQHKVDKEDGSDVETILSLSEGECAEEAQLSVTLDFPC